PAGQSPKGATGRGSRARTAWNCFCRSALRCELLGAWRLGFNAQIFVSKYRLSHGNYKIAYLTPKCQVQPERTLRISDINKAASCWAPYFSGDADLSDPQEVRASDG